MPEPTLPEVRISPDFTKVAIRNHPTPWTQWRVSDGGYYPDDLVADWLPLPFVKANIGFASEGRLETDIMGRRARMLPYPEMPGGDAACLTMMFAPEMFDRVQREHFAEHVSDVLASKIREMILQGPERLAGDQDDDDA